MNKAGGHTGQEISAKADIAAAMSLVEGEVEVI